MMVLRNSGGFLTGNQVVPLDYEAEVSHRLLHASLCNDLKLVAQCLSDPFVDVNYVGAVCLKIRKSSVVLHEESPIQVHVEYQELRTDVTPLFVAVANGSLSLVRKLLSIGADVNLQLFRGFVTAAAAREGNLEILEILLKSGASQPACEEALLEVSIHGHSHLVELLMGSDLIRPHVAVHALVSACCRGFVEVVDALMKCGVDLNASDRILLQSYKPSLHANANCTALVAAIVSRQVSVVRLLLEAGARTDVKAQLGAWSWDVNSGEELRVGAGLAEPYPLTWCAVEYFEATGSILRMLLQHISHKTLHLGRNLLHHAILCNCKAATEILLKCGAQIETPVKTTQKNEFRPIHMAAHLGLSDILQCLIDSNCDLNSRTSTGDTSLMISARYHRYACIQVLTKAGADIGLVNQNGQSACSIARSNPGFQQALLHAMRSGTMPVSSSTSVFSPLLFVAQSGDVIALRTLIEHADIDLNQQDNRGFSAAMIAAMNGHIDAFRVLLYAGANINKSGETTVALFKLIQNRDLFEKVMLEFALEKSGVGFHFPALHCAARHGDINAVKLLASKGYDINSRDADEYTPLMLAAKQGNAAMCELLITYGAHFDVKNVRGESALSLARKFNGKQNLPEIIILNAIARKLVLTGSYVKKHTKRGKGSPHMKVLTMVESTGILRWGKSSFRNVVCREAEVGPSLSFRRNRQKKGDGNESGLFRVRTSKNKEVHFVCEGGVEMAELWVRGIRLVMAASGFGISNVYRYDQV